MAALTISGFKKTGKSKGLGREMVSEAPPSMKRNKKAVRGRHALKRRRALSSRRCHRLLARAAGAEGLQDATAAGDGVGTLELAELGLCSRGRERQGSGEETINRRGSQRSLEPSHQHQQEHSDAMSCLEKRSGVHR